MNILIWIIQGVLAVSFILAGILKVSTPKAKLEAKMPWAQDVWLLIISSG